MTVLRRLRFPARLFCTLFLFAFHGLHAANALEPGWDVLQVYGGGNDGAAQLLTYDRDTGRAALFDQGYTGFDRMLVSERGLRKTWNTILVYNRNNIITYDPGMDEVEINNLDAIFGKNLKTYEFREKKWNNIFPIKYLDGEESIFFYDKDDGIAAIYRVDKRNGVLRTPPVADETLGEGWDILVPFTLAGTVHLLLYDRDEGRAVIRTLPHGGKLGARTYESSGWRKNWHAIEAFYGDSSGPRPPYLLFYDKAAGAGEVYAVNADGTIGASTSRDLRWGVGWDFVGVAHQGKGAPAFVTLYDRTSGAVGIYVLTDDGKIGKKYK